MVWFMMFDASFNNILATLWRSVLLVEETGVPGKPIELTYVVSSTPRHDQGSNSQL
jgi:hypothetical protein